MQKFAKVEQTKVKKALDEVRKSQRETAEQDAGQSNQALAFNFNKNSRDNGNMSSGR